MLIFNILDLSHNFNLPLSLYLRYRNVHYGNVHYDNERVDIK